MRPPSGSGQHLSGQHLTEEQLDRAQQVVTRLKALFPPERGALTRLENASKAAGFRLKQQSMSAVLRNRQCGYMLAEQIMAYAKTRKELRDLPANFIIGGGPDVDKVGTLGASIYALRPMKYRAKGEFLDSLVGSLPAEFLDFTAERDPSEPEAAAWQPVDWYLHTARELELWKYLKSQKKRK